MQNTNENLSIGNRIKQNVASVVSRILIREAEMSIKESINIILYEPKYPIELLYEVKK